jgi:hypothetical protein
MKKYILFCLLGYSAMTLNAQTKTKYETVFFEDVTEESIIARFNVTGALSENEVIKAKVKVTNYTDKTLVLKPEECFYTTAKGDLASRDRWIIIAPRQQESKVIDVKGNDLKTEATTLKINGLYVCNHVESFDAGSIALPPEKEMVIGNFRVELDGYDQDGKEIMIKYKIRYIGDKIGSFVPAKVTLKSAEGQEYKNMKEKDKVYSFKKNEDYLVGFLYISDSKKGNKLSWNTAFGESVPEKTENVNIELKMDFAKTKDKN